MQEPADSPVCSRKSLRFLWLTIPFATLVLIGSVVAKWPPESAPGLPVVECPAPSSSSTDLDLFAIMVSGDGGWRAIDRDIASVLVTHGVPVAGLVSSDYFAERRTANESSTALDRLIVDYGRLWHRRRVILVGYSRGAGVLPFMISRLPQAERARIATVALLALEPSIDFKSSPRVLLWAFDDEVFVPVRPELRRLHDEGLDAASTLCIAGRDDGDSICRGLPADVASSVLLPGGHHFGGNYRSIATRILAEAHATMPAMKVASARPVVTRAIVNSPQATQPQR